MDFFTFVVVVVAISAGSSIISSILRPKTTKMRRKDLELMKAELREELAGETSHRALPDEVSRRLEHLEDHVAQQERTIEQLQEENDFLKRLVDDRMQ